MAPLTWRNVDSPNFSSSNQMYQIAAGLMNNGFDSARKGLGDFRDITTDEQSAQLMQSVMAAGNDPNAIAAATAGANPAYLSADALKFANNQQGVLLDREGAGLRNGIAGQSIRANDFNFNRSQIAATRADDDYALMPEALKAMGSIREDMASGDPARIANATASQGDFLGKYGRTLGINDASQLGSFINNNIQAEQDGMTLNKDRLSYASGLDQMLRNKDAKGIATNIIGYMDNDPAKAIKAVQGMNDLDLDTKAAVIAQITDYQSVLPAKTAAESALEGAGSFLGNPNGGANLPANYQAVVMNNSGAVRNKPLSENLDRTLNLVLPRYGVTARVNSGGQDEAGRKKLKSSERHTHGNAADVEFLASDGRVLSWEKPQDVPLLQQVVGGLKEAGLTGMGAASDYMGATTTHIGYGKEAVWGKKGGEPYQALLDAFNGTKSSGNQPNSAANAEGYKAAMDAMSNGQSYEAPLDPTRAQIINADGTTSTESTFTAKIGDAWFNIPSIVNGEKLPEKEAMAEFEAGNNPAVGVFQSKREAESSAEVRTDELGKMLEQASTNPVASSAGSQTQATNQALNEQLTPTLEQTTAPARAANVTNVDPSQSAFVQDIQGLQRKGDIKGAIAGIKNKLAVGDGDILGGAPLSSGAGSMWDYFTATPQDAASNSASRASSKEALSFYQSDQANKYFQENPDQLTNAASDPITFAQNYKSNNKEQKQTGSMQISDGSTPNKDLPVNDPRRDPNYVQRELTGAENVDQMISIVQNTAAVDSVNDTGGPINAAIRDADNNSGKVLSDVINELSQGSLAGYNKGDITNAMRKITKAAPGISASVAGVLLANNPDYANGFFGIGEGFDVDLDGALAQWKEYQNSTKGIAGANNAVSNLNNEDAKKAQLAKLNTVAERYKAQEASLTAALADPNTSAAQKAQIEDTLEQVRLMAAAQLGEVYNSGALTRNLATKTGR